MKELRFAILGTGFWARYQLAAWRELPGVRCVALYNRTRSKADLLAKQFEVPATYDDAEALIDCEKPDFLDIITDVGTHRSFVELAASRRIPVICQKPMAPALPDAEAMVGACKSANIPFFVHENWRWQTPMRELKRILNSGIIGKPFRARIDFVCSFPVFDNQPFLKELEQFILTDIGSHVLDIPRFLFGEAASLYCQTHRVNPAIKGEDVATVVLQMINGATTVCNLSYASRTAIERFPETYVFIEGAKGSLELGPDFWLRTTTIAGTIANRYPPPEYSWADPRYALVHSSIVGCNRDILRALKGAAPAETTAEDNLQTVRLVHAAYDSARDNRVVYFPEYNPNLNT
ncbi:MAG: putative oxidoreductase [Verrucomicrobiales bacterium]|nr:putative oxidoreductase [Verrucomicrobiales bacterium]